MRGPKEDCIAVRTPDGGIDLKKTPNIAAKKTWWKKVPVVRGVISFVQTLIVGYKALMYSAEKSADLDFEEEELSKFDKWIEKHFGQKMMMTVGIISVVLSLAISLFLFKFLPMLAVKGLEALGLQIGSNIIKSIIEGVIKTAIFIGYLAVISLMKDIRTTYMYHGAEHKTIACYEAGEELTPENAAKHTRFHPRCGTSFMFLMVALGILVNCFLPWSNIWMRLGLSLLVFPVVMGLGYELLKFCGRHDNLFTRIVSAPGKWMQRLTTKEPTLKQLEIAIAAIKEVIPDDGSDKLTVK